ncbi:hypothetical protein BO79DRAFT_206184 [Aspergillus costaricaensis CBS 115574]|uniref:Uncharacterized protein n=1 Tax=Aspergillus costaricaensis CBS 115574 TaxID=1448317 RepID=A0ACD1IUX8_9EURO|nr:hypothetical protein BO79DRAFT_206184 [Aspergillus costaricaensis CBS 115574]RAK94456.1 hypothetical protein BO79DRAFT_206184 [Aspergillus costaricaensis CBS 115574]
MYVSFSSKQEGKESQILRSVRILTVEKADYGMDQENQGSRERERERERERGRGED